MRPRPSVYCCISKGEEEEKEENCRAPALVRKVIFSFSSSPFCGLQYMAAAAIRRRRGGALFFFLRGGGATAYAAQKLAYETFSLLLFVVAE